MPGADGRPSTPRPSPWRARPQGSARPVVPVAGNGPENGHSHGPSRPGRAGEVRLSTLHADPFARVTLALLRWQFQTFAAPETQGWLMALRLASDHAGPHRAGALFHDLAAMVQALRCARTTPFRFNPEGCACCRAWLTPEERQLMALLDALRQGQTGRARTYVQLLCDGAPDRDLIAMAAIYLRNNAPAQAPAGTARL